MWRWLVIKVLVETIQLVGGSVHLEGELDYL